MWLLQLGLGFDQVRNVGRASGISADRDLKKTLIDGLQIGFRFVALLALVALVIGGLLYILSFGNEDRAKTAKRIILYAIIGLLILAVSGMLVNFVIRLFA